jgi:hypothetical protein
MANGLFGARGRELSDVGWISKRRSVVNVDRKNSDRSVVAFLAFTRGQKSEGLISIHRALAFNHFVSVYGINCCHEANVISPLLNNIYFYGCSIS